MSMEGQSDGGKIPEWILDIHRAASASPRPGNQIDQAVFNLERVRTYYETHLGCTRKDCMRALGLTMNQVNYCMKKLRKEWPTQRGNKCTVTKSTT